MAQGSEDESAGTRSVQQNAVRVLSDIAQTLRTTFPVTTGIVGSATAGAATLPANPVGFLTVVLPNGDSALIPYYDL